MTVMAKLGDISRFDNPGQLMAYLRQVPSEYSSSKPRRRDGITKTGHGPVRCMLTESAWCYRFPTCKTASLKRRTEKPSGGTIAWKAQKRLSGRYRHLPTRGMLKKVQGCPAIAQELMRLGHWGFVE